MCGVRPGYYLDNGEDALIMSEGRQVVMHNNKHITLGIESSCVRRQ